MRCITPQYLAALISVVVAILVIGFAVLFENSLVNVLPIGNIDDIQGFGNIEQLKTETLKLKIQTLHKVMDICMLWWVSSIALCLSVLGAVWIQRDYIIEHLTDKNFSFARLGNLISWLLCLIIIFPTWVMIILIFPYLQVAALTDRWLYLPEFIGVWLSLLIGISGYFVVFKIWENTLSMLSVQHRPKLIKLNF